MLPFYEINFCVRFWRKAFFFSVCIYFLDDKCKLEASFIRGKNEVEVILAGNLYILHSYEQKYYKVTALAFASKNIT